ncbi:MAG: methyltransferase domain-containing protein [Pseudomonadota bacterium]|nr:MAG: SAM-dependent methyltransferase [Pseudomonadota bacterium]
MYAALKRYRTTVPQARALSISHSERLCEVLGIARENIVTADYPEYNILNLPREGAPFDYVVADQVLEHVEGDPRAAIASCADALKTGGLLVVTTCLMQPIHGWPGDYWRFTPDGLRLLCGDELDVLEAAGWGNPAVLALDWLRLRFLPVPEARWHPMHWVATWNRADWPISTWVVARKR